MWISIPYRRSHINQAALGFTLVEMSVVLIIIGLVILLVYPAMIALRTATQQNATRTAFEATSRALAAFVQANGRLPCPMPASAVGSGFGVEKNTSATTQPSCGRCQVSEGVVPFITLGLPPTLVKDGWGHWLTFSVDTCLADTYLRLPLIPASTDPTSQRALCRVTRQTANTLTVNNLGGAVANAAFVLVSHGTNTCGTYLASSLSNGLNGQRLTGTHPACAAFSLEDENKDGDRVYTLAPSGDLFDDQVFWLDRNALVSFLGTGGCTGVW